MTALPLGLLLPALAAGALALLAFRAPPAPVGPAPAAFEGPCCPAVLA